MSKKPTPSPLEEGLISAMRAIDNQIARSMQRTPAMRDEHGVQKWQPFEDKLEAVSAIVLNAFGDKEITLDSILVLSEAFAKSLYILVDELGEEGLGDVRSNYCKQTMEKIKRDAEFGIRSLVGAAGEHLN